jgi:hypothetical protein
VIDYPRQIAFCVDPAKTAFLLERFQPVLHIQWIQSPASCVRQQRLIVEVPASIAVPPDLLVRRVSV